MKKIVKISLIASIAMGSLTSSLFAADTISDAFANGKFKGALKSYYFAQTFDKASGNKDSSIWANGGIFSYTTDSYKGFVLGSTFQTSNVTSIDDKSAKTAGSMDAQGSVLSEAYLQYTFDKTTLKGGRQFISTPLLAGSGSRLIKESFEAYLLANTDIPNTTVVAGIVTKYQTRTDKSNYSDNSFVNYVTGNGGPGKFYDINKNGDGVSTLLIKNNSIKDLNIQFQYAVVPNVADVAYLDAKYNFGPAYVAAQYFNTNYDASSSSDSSMYGFKVGTKISNIDLFAGYTSTDKANDVVRGIGQGAYAQYTATTKTAGADAFKAGTDAWQIGAGYEFNKLKTKLRYSNFNRPTVGDDLKETTLNFEYKIDKNLKAQVDYSILDYEINSKDATDIRTRLIYSF